MNMSENQQCCDNCGKWYDRETMLTYTGRKLAQGWKYYLCSLPCLQGMLEWWGKEA